jgi:hypothetical protein
LTDRSHGEHSDAIVAIKDVSFVVLGAVLGGVITWLLVSPSPGESFPVVFRGTTQGVSSDGDGVAFYPNDRFTDVFGVFPRSRSRARTGAMRRWPLRVSLLKPRSRTWSSRS